MKIFVPNVAGDRGFALAKRFLGRGDSVVGVDDLSDPDSLETKAARLSELGIRDIPAMLSEESGGDGTFPAPSRFCGKFRFYLCSASDVEAVSRILKRERCDAVPDKTASGNETKRLNEDIRF